MKKTVSIFINCLNLAVKANLLQSSTLETCPTNGVSDSSTQSELNCNKKLVFML